MEYLVTFMSGAGGAALVTGVFALYQHWRARRDRQSDRHDAQSKALRYLLLYIIQERAKQHIKDGSITLEERRSLHHWHELYHTGLGGNGDADALMAMVDKLPLNTAE